MSTLFQTIQQLVERGKVRISEHGYDELAADGLFAKEVVDGVVRATVVEEYPTFPKGPCVLTLQHDGQQQPVHVVWGIPKGRESPAVLVTAYRPDPQRWTDDYLRRRQ